VAPERYPAPLELEGARGRVYRPLDAELEARLPGWVARGAFEGTETIKPGRVFRLGEHLVKRFPREPAPKRWLRPSPAERNARAHLGLGVRTPRPELTLRGNRASGLAGGSLLVGEFVRGSHLPELWDAEPDAVAAFAGFMATAHRAGVFHGDFHLWNVIWNGAEWVLLDLEGLRHPLRRLDRRRLVLDQWARVYWSLERDPRVRDLVDGYLDAAGLGWAAGRTWEEVVAREAELRRRRAEGGHPEGPPASQTAVRRTRGEPNA